MADNLLDKASILLTPTAYNDGRMLSVKPENGDGDFTFSRGSAATRVNAQGLVENVQIISDELVSNGNFSQEGSELITNGDFATDSDWTLGSGWSIGEDEASCDGTNNADITQVGSTVGKTYKATLSITENNVGRLNVYIGGTFAGQTTNGAIGDFTFYATATDTNLIRLRSNNSFNGSITNISVKEVGQDWVFSSGATLTDLGAKITHTPTAGSIAQSSVLVLGKNYKITYEITESVSGGLKMNSAVDASMVTTVGTHTKYFEADLTTLSISRTDASNNDITITNISLKEITDDTNIPRINYTDGCGSWLLEPQSTNLITYSEDFSQSFYTKDSGVSVGSSNNTSPSGDMNATQINVTDNGRIYSNMSSLTYYSSVFIKAGTFFYFKFAGINVDLVSETIVNGKIESYGNGWFRISVPYTGNRPFQIQAYPDATYSSHTTSGNYYIWGSQAEEQLYATSYIPTNGATNTRLQDIATNSGNASLINSTEGVLYAEISGLANYNLQRWLSLSDGTTSNTVKIGIANSTTDYRFACEVRSGAVLSAFMTYNFGAVEPTFVKIAFKYKENDFALWVNGVEVATDTSGSAPIGLSQLNFDRGDGAQKFEGKTKAVAVYKEVLTDAELQSLTSN